MGRAQGKVKGRIASRIALKKFYSGRTNEVQRYFEHIPVVLEDNIPLEICLAYVFLKAEEAQNRVLHGGVVKKYKCNAELSIRIINIHHLTRDGFKALYKNIFGKPMNEDISKKIEAASKTRDRVIHGKDVPDSDLREAIADVLEYGELINAELNFNPFGSMQGFNGRGAGSLDKRTTKLVMKGLGFGVTA